MNVLSLWTAFWIHTPLSKIHAQHNSLNHITKILHVATEKFAMIDDFVYVSVSIVLSVTRYSLPVYWLSCVL